jgi:hypothetical protein
MLSFKTKFIGKIAGNIPATLVAALFLASNVYGTPAERYAINQHGDMVIFGNTLGYDCRTVIPKPTVGIVEPSMCGTFPADQDIDVLWRSDEPSAGKATASPSITPDMARSTAMLVLPAGAIVTYARLYASAEAPKGMVMPFGTLTIERPGVFSKSVRADSTGQLDVAGLIGTHYQQTSDITDLVQTYGSGAYRLGNLLMTSPVDQSDQLLYAGWDIVVFYRLPSLPMRSLRLFDGFDYQTGSMSIDLTFNGFNLPASKFDGRMGLVAYQGDVDATGDRVFVNGGLIADAIHGPTNFFNSSHSYLGAAVTTVGDLPQTTGMPGSLAGLDIAVIDITGQLRASDTSIDVAFDTTNDVIFFGQAIASVSAVSSSFEGSQLTYNNVTHPGSTFHAGDKLQITAVAPNSGNDGSTQTYETIEIPDEVTYVPASLEIDNGSGFSSVTDKAGDDQAEYDAMTKTLKVRIGFGATASKGGSIATAGPVPSFRFRVTIDPIQKTCSNARIGGKITANGIAAEMAHLPPQSWNTGSVFTALDGANKGVAAFYPDRALSLPISDCTIFANGFQ